MVAPTPRMWTFGRYGESLPLNCRALALFQKESASTLSGYSMQFHLTLPGSDHGELRFGLAENAQHNTGDGQSGTNDPRDDRGVGVLEAEPKTKIKKPSLYKVLMLNDDYTPMEFVVHVLVNFFGKNEQQATQIMLHVHQKGVGICGIYTLEVAEAKVTQTIDFARQNNHPLQCEIEKDE